MFVALLCFASAFFLNFQTSALAAPAVIINEIAWMGDASSSTREWIELYNPGAEDVLLEKWKLQAKDGQPDIEFKTGKTIQANSFFLLERAEEAVASVTAEELYSGSLSNAGEYLELIDDQGAVIDLIDASHGWPGGSNLTKATLERQADLSWATSSIAGGTPHATNSSATILIITNEDKPADSEIITTDKGSEQAANSVPISLNRLSHIWPGEIVINEFVSDPLEGEDEWVEIYLSTDKKIDLNSVTLEDGAKTKTQLKGGMDQANRFLVIEKPKGSLNNAGDILILRDGYGEIIDQIVYGNWSNGQFNAAAPRDGQSLARRFDGVNSFNLQADWAVTAMPTKNAANRITNDDNGKPVDTKAISISEILPDPNGDDAKGEFIELYNRTEEVVSLAGWRLEVQSGQSFRFGSSSTIGSHEYKAFYRTVTHLPLLNNNGSLKLFPPSSDKASQGVNYKNGKSGQSYIREDGGWHWTEMPTPGTANKLREANQAPTAAFYFKTPTETQETVFFDSSDTVDSEDDVLSYKWSFGDGASSTLPNPEHAYVKAGSYRVKLEVTDGKNKAVVQELIKVNKKNTDRKETIKLSKDSSVVINEILPNPEGSDEAEWIELYNSGDVPVSLLDWILDDGEGGSSPYRIDEDLQIEAKSYLLLERTETGIALNNNADAVRLYDSSGRLADKTEYSKASEGESWARRSDNRFAWTGIGTPGQANIIRSENKSSKTAKKKTSKSSSTDKEPGEEAVFRCAVTSLPNQLASQYFYCENDRGWQIYNYKKDFPKLKLDDLVEIRGIVSQTGGNWRLKIRDRASIKLVGSKVMTATAIGTEDIGTAHAGKLVRFEGEVTKKSGSSFYLDDGNGEISVQLKKGAGLAASMISEGESYQVSGIMQVTQSGMKIMPRSRDDIKRMNGSSFLGEAASTSETELIPESKSKSYFMILGSSSLLVAGLWLMKRAGMKF